MTKINESFSDIYGRYLRAAKGRSTVITQEALTDSQSTKSLSTDSYATESLSAELVPTYFLQLDDQVFFLRKRNRNCIIGV